MSLEYRVGKGNSTLSADRGYSTSNMAQAKEPNGLLSRISKYAKTKTATALALVSMGVAGLAYGQQAKTYFAQFADAPGIETTLTLTNPGDKPVNVNVEFTQ